MGSTGGWNRPSANQPTVTKKRTGLSPVVKGIVAGVVVILGAVVAYECLFENAANHPAKVDKERGRIKAVKPAAVPKTSEGRSTDGLSHARDILNEQVKEFIKKKTPTNGVSWKMPDLAPDDPDRILYTRLSQELGAILAVEPGDPIPPLPFSFIMEDRMRAEAAEGLKVKPDNGNSAFLEQLKKWKVTAKESDSLSQLERKQRLNEAHNELLAAMDEGTSVNDSIRAAYEFRVNAHEMRSTIVRTLAELHEKDGDQAHTIEQIKDMNSRLADDGIKAISIAEVIPDYETEEEVQ